MSGYQDLALDLLLVREVDRRREPRLKIPFPAVVRGVDAAGHMFEEQIVIENISPHGLHICLSRSIKSGVTLFIVVQLSAAPAGKPSAPRVAVRAQVVRADPCPERVCGLGLTFTQHRFLYKAM